jgi:tetratricopeptide (TPR) repeat protein
MGFTDWFRRQATSSPPPDLLGALIDAVDHRDANRLMALVNQNTERIKAEFNAWTSVPEPIRDDQEALGRYVNTLLTLGTLFERSGDRSLKDRLDGRGRGDNPMTQWTSTIERADRLMGEGKSAGAVPLLRASLDQLRGLSGTAVTHFQPLLLGRLGMALRQMGDKDEAIRVTREALELCKEAGDAEGVQAYTRNLQTMGAPEFAQSLGDAGFHIVFHDADGRVLSSDEVSVASGTIRFEVRSGRNIHPEAQRLHEEGRATGARGDHSGAIVLFNQAAAIDPAWPYPVYDRAFAHLIMREFDAALVDYRKSSSLRRKDFTSRRQPLTC